MKKIVIFTQNLDFGGVQKSVYYLANNLKKEYAVSIVLAEDNKEIKYNFEGIPIYQIRTLKVNVNEEGIGEKLFEYRIKELDKQLSILNPDILISYEDYNNLIALSTKYNCKKVVSCRVSIKDSYENTMIHLLDSSFYYQKMHLLYKDANKIVSVSNSINNELKEEFSLTNTVTIHNGIEKKELETKVEHKSFILNIGRLHKQKGQEDLIKAFYKIKDEINENLIIVGDGMMKDYLMKLVEDLNLNSRVFIVGFDEPYKYIKACSLFIFPSYYEGFSNTILEVMSCKKNIVSYEYKGSEEVLLKENRVSIGDIDLLASKIVYYLKNKKENEILADKLFKKSNEFSLSRTLEKYKKEIKLLCVE